MTPKNRKRLTILKSLINRYCFFWFILCKSYFGANVRWKLLEVFLIQCFFTDFSLKFRISFALPIPITDYVNKSMLTSCLSTFANYFFSFSWAGFFFTLFPSSPSAKRLILRLKPSLYKICRKRVFYQLKSTFRGFWKCSKYESRS